MSSWPEVNDRVVLVRGDGERCTTRVEDDARGLLAVADPIGDGWSRSGRIGARFDLQWPSERGVWSAPVLLRGLDAGPVPLWWVEPVGHPELDQRRNHVRAQAPGATVRIGWPGLDRGELDGVVADLSEGGTRVVLPSWVDVEAEEPVTCRVRAGSTVLDLPGWVLRATHPRGATEVVITFDELPEQLGSQVRQLVFAWQRLSRR